MIGKSRRVVQPCLRPEDIRRIRERLGMSRLELARKLRVEYDSVRHWEMGRRVPNPQVQLLLRLLEAGFDFDAYLVR